MVLKMKILDSYVGINLFEYQFNLDYGFKCYNKDNCESNDFMNM